MDTNPIKMGVDCLSMKLNCPALTPVAGIEAAILTYRSLPDFFSSPMDLIRISLFSFPKFLGSSHAPLKTALYKNTASPAKIPYIRDNGKLVENNLIALKPPRIPLASPVNFEAQTPFAARRLKRAVRSRSWARHWVALEIRSGSGNCLFLKHK